MNTEITDEVDEAPRGRVFYDADCAFCRRWADVFRRRLEGGGFALAPLQSADARALLNVSEDQLLMEMRVITRQGEMLGGADALLHLAGNLGGGRRIGALARVPGIRPSLRWLYRFVARYRSCPAGACRTRVDGHPALHRAIGVLPLVLMTGATLVVGRAFSPWGYMWALATALYAGCKWMTFQDALTHGANPGPAKTVGYLLAWSGMDARAFFRGHPSIERVRGEEALPALAKMLAGMALIWGATRVMFPRHPLLAGWIGMGGIVLLLHFGLFQLLSLAWRNAGVDAAPLMRAPLRSKSVGEFWGSRWNTAFRCLANGFVFRAVRSKVGLRTSTMIVFGVSGLIHELVISVPARGGYGLPTAYFLIQGAAILLEHTRFGAKVGAGRGRTGWWFTVLLTAGPACLLFHPPFVLRVIIPFLKTIGAL